MGSVRILIYVFAIRSRSSRASRLARSAEWWNSGINSTLMNRVFFSSCGRVFAWRLASKSLFFINLDTRGWHQLQDGSNSASNILQPKQIIRCQERICALSTSSSDWYYRLNSLSGGMEWNAEAQSTEWVAAKVQANLESSRWISTACLVTLCRNRWIY